MPSTIATLRLADTALPSSGTGPLLAQPVRGASGGAHAPAEEDGTVDVSARIEAFAR